MKKKQNNPHKNGHSPIVQDTKIRTNIFVWSQIWAKRFDHLKNKIKSKSNFKIKTSGFDHWTKTSIFNYYFSIQNSYFWFLLILFLFFLNFKLLQVQAHGPELVWEPGPVAFRKRRPYEVNKPAHTVVAIGLTAKKQTKKPPVAKLQLLWNCCSTNHKIWSTHYEIMYSLTTKVPIWMYNMAEVSWRQWD